MGEGLYIRMCDMAKQVYMDGGTLGTVHLSDQTLEQLLKDTPPWMRPSERDDYSFFAVAFGELRIVIDNRVPLDSMFVLER